MGTTIDPAKRCGSELEAKAWLDTVVATYAQCSSISLSAAGAGGASGGGGGGATINSEEFLKFQAKQEQSAAQHIKLYMCYLKRESRAGNIAYDDEKANSAELQAKLDSIAKTRTLKAFNLFLILSKPAVLIHLGTGLVKMP